MSNDGSDANDRNAGTTAHPETGGQIDPADLNQDSAEQADSEEPDPEFTGDQRPRGFVIGGQPGVGIVGTPSNDQGV